jgi:ubiquinone/menaquinone biosynthesis C-methylase UbiE
MGERWHDPGFAAEWDARNMTGNPMRAEYLQILLAIIAGEEQAGLTVLDLGVGTGRVAAPLLERLPGVRLVGVDGSAAMLDLARQRLQPYADRCILIQHDFAEIATLQLPPGVYRIALSVQALHHVPHAAQRAVLRHVYGLLEAGGLFLHAERIAIDVEHLAPVYGAVWERLEEQAEEKSGWDRERYLRRQRERHDHIATLDEHLAWLREAGFTAACVYLQLDRALFVGRKT